MGNRFRGLLFVVGAAAIPVCAMAGKPQPPAYTPTVVNVACDGTGTKLQDALNAVNPTANVYDFRISGTCPESLKVSGFSQLTLRSSDLANPATIGRVTLVHLVRIPRPPLMARCG